MRTERDPGVPVLESEAFDTFGRTSYRWSGVLLEDRPIRTTAELGKCWAPVAAEVAFRFDTFCVDQAAAATRGAAGVAVEPRTGPLLALVVGPEDWAVEQSAATLRREGLAVLRCHEPGEPAFPCNALRPDRTCPLDIGFDVVVDVRGRPQSSVPAAELGVTCALRAGVPLVIGGMAAGSPFQPWATAVVAPHENLAVVCQAVAHRETTDLDLDLGDDR